MTLVFLLPLSPPLCMLPVQVNKKDLQGIPDYILSRIPQPSGQASDRFTLVTDQSVMGDVLKNARSGEARRAMYVAGHSVAAENVQARGRDGGIKT